MNQPSSNLQFLEILDTLSKLLENRRDESPWMGLKQLQDYLPKELNEATGELEPVSEQMIRYWRNHKGMPCSKPGRNPIFHRDEIDKWLLNLHKKKKGRR